MTVLTAYRSRSARGYVTDDGVLLKCTVTVEEQPHPLPGFGPPDYRLRFRWTSPDVKIDRPIVHYIATGDGHRGLVLANRFVLAYREGAIRHHKSCGQPGEAPDIRTDVNGNTYVGASLPVIGKYLAGDLRALGY